MLRGAENVQKHPLQTFPCIFWGGQLLGSGFYNNIYPFWGFWELIYTYKRTIYTIWVTLQPVQVSMTCKLLQKHSLKALALLGSLVWLRRPVAGQLNVPAALVLSVCTLF